ncbi:MAG: ABC transporter substrate-binding protein [Methylococcales bacterium]
MKIRNFDRILAGLFLVLVAVYIVYEVGKKPRVLVLHSYGTDYKWVAEVSQGINRILDGKPYSIRWHYMDTKRHPEDAFKLRAGQAARDVIEQWQPNVILTVADNAQQLVGRNYVNDPRFDIVYSGVFANPSEYGYDRASNVTGILERWPLDVIRQGITEIFVKGDSNRTTPIRVCHIGDASETVSFLCRQIADFDWGQDIRVESIQARTFKDWQREISVIDDRYDLVLFSLYHTLLRDDKKDEAMPPAQVMHWTQANLHKPNIAGWGFTVEEGGMMAIGVSALEQGEEAARAVVQIIDGRRPTEIQPLRSKQFLIYLRRKELVKYRVRVPRIFEAFARATNNYYVD